MLSRLKKRSGCVKSFSMTSKKILVVASLFLLFPYAGMGQCLDTNTLLDSVHSINLGRLNSIRRLNELDNKLNKFRPALDSIYRIGRQNKGDIYRAIILYKVLKGKFNIYSKVDSSSFYLGNNYEDGFVTKVKFMNQANFALILLSDSFHNLYLATVGKDLALIDFVPFETDEFSGYNVTKSAKGIIIRLRESGITSTLNEQGVITQIDFSILKHQKTMAVLQSWRRTMYYKIGIDGSISTYTAMPTK